MQIKINNDNINIRTGGYQINNDNPYFLLLIYLRSFYRTRLIFLYDFGILNYKFIIKKFKNKSEQLT